MLPHVAVLLIVVEVAPLVWIDLGLPEVNRRREGPLQVMEVGCGGPFHLQDFRNMGLGHGAITGLVIVKFGR